MKYSLLNIHIPALIFFLCALLMAPEVVLAQNVNGVVKSKTSTLSFENYGSGNLVFNGEIHSNLAGSKYTVNLMHNENTFKGVITDKLSKYIVDLNYQSNSIKGQIKRSPNQTKDEWDIQFLEQRLSGTVTHNSMNTVDTYDLKCGNGKITGTISKNLNALTYDMTLNAKKISGYMSFNVTTVKHTYELETEQLTENEMVLLLFVEIIKLLNERADDISDFQDNE